jgi:hypothetical protein
MTDYRARWYRGEILSGWMVMGYEEGNALEKAGIARYMSGWGTHLSADVARELTQGAAPTERIEDGTTIEFSQIDVDRVAEMVREEKARKAKARPALVQCDCGHRVPATLVMNASLGTACPDCYDDMSA